SLDKFLSKKIVVEVGIKTPKGNLYYLDHRGKKHQQLGRWKVRFPAIIKNNFRGDSEGIDQDSVVHNSKDLERILNKRLKQLPEGVLVEEFIKGKDIGVCYMEGMGRGNALFPIESVISKELNNPYNIVDYNLKNYAIRSTTIQHLSIRLADDLPKKLIRKIEDISRKVFEIFQVKDFVRVDFRVTDSGEVYFIELNPLLTMLAGTHMFYAAKEKHGLTYGDVLDHIFRKAAKRWGLKYHKSNTGLFSKMRY
ncbi:unnamed protein product, partial [marine sediment metagenome]